MNSTSKNEYSKNEEKILTNKHIFIQTRYRGSHILLMYGLEVWTFSKEINWSQKQYRYDFLEKFPYCMDSKEIKLES